MTKPKPCLMTVIRTSMVVHTYVRTPGGMLYGVSRPAPDVVKRSPACTITEFTNTWRRHQRTLEPTNQPSLSPACAHTYVRSSVHYPADLWTARGYKRTRASALQMRPATPSSATRFAHSPPTFPKSSSDTSPRRAMYVRTTYVRTYADSDPSLVRHDAALTGATGRLHGGNHFNPNLALRDDIHRHRRVEFDRQRSQVHVHLGAAVRYL